MTTTMTRDGQDTVNTRASLVQGLQAGDEDRWREFCRVYGPVIRGFGIKAGLTETEADEVVQETTIAVARHVAEFHYDPKVCRFKTWLLNQTSWRVKDALKKRRRWDDRVHGPATGPHGGTGETPALRCGDRTRTATIERLPDPAGPRLEELWDTEWQTKLLEVALEKVKEQVDLKQWQIFDLCALKQWSAGDVARTLGVSAARVYLAKHRVAKLVKAEVRRAEGAGILGR